VSWLKNGQELPSKCELKYDHNKVSLKMSDLNVDDAGRYSCKVENEAGTACSTADIVVKSKQINVLNDFYVKIILQKQYSRP